MLVAAVSCLSTVKIHTNSCAQVMLDWHITILMTCISAAVSYHDITVTWCLRSIHHMKPKCHTCGFANYTCQQYKQLKLDRQWHDSDKGAATHDTRTQSRIALINWTIHRYGDGHTPNSGIWRHRLWNICHTTVDPPIIWHIGPYKCSKCFPLTFTYTGPEPFAPVVNDRVNDRVLHPRPRVNRALLPIVNVSYCVWHIFTRT